MTTKPEITKRLSDPYRSRGFILTIYENAEGDDHSVDLTEAGQQVDPDQNLNALRKCRRELVMAGLVFQFKSQGHFRLSLTRTGEDFAKWLLHQGHDWGVDEGMAKINMPEPPFRVGLNHLVPQTTYRKLIKAVNEGKLDLVVIPRQFKIKTKYWDEA